jgi:tRNA threonylcarbamoyl adenosine modification protein (Sua5/YciO/YrdC/YwlC family)
MINQIKNIIQNEGVVIFPTDTVLALACSPYSKKAIDKIYKIKQRDRNKPLALLVSSIEQLQQIGILNEIGHKLLSEHSPGSITLICKLRPDIDFSFAAKNNTIGLRITTNPVALFIIKAIDSSLVATSVNISGDLALTDTINIAKKIRSQVDYVIEGKSSSSNASKIVDISAGHEVYLR